MLYTVKRRSIVLTEAQLSHPNDFCQYYTSNLRECLYRQRSTNKEKMKQEMRKNLEATQKRSAKDRYGHRLYRYN